MEETELEQFLKTMKKETLSPKEKVSLWHAISASLPKRAPAQKVLFTITKYTHMTRKQWGTIAIALVLLVGAGGTTTFANYASPGDFLYPLDRAVENVRMAIASPEQKDALRIAFSIERVEEAEKILSAFTVALSPVTATSTTATQTVPVLTSTSTNLSQKKLAKAEVGLATALAYIQESRAQFEDEGNTGAVETLNLIATRLSQLTDKHLEDLEKVTVKITDNKKGVKAEVQVISDTLKTKFKIEDKKNSEVKISFSSSTRSDDKGNDDKKDNKDDHGKGGKDNDRDDDRDDDDKKITLCHNKKETISVSMNSLWAHLKHGDSKGSCTEKPTTQVPTFSAVTSSTEKTTARIVWRTNKETTGTVWYSTSSNVLVASSTLRFEDTKNDDKHDITLTNLTPDTTYYFIITAKDSAGNVGTSSERTFRTQREDATAPIISNVSSSASVATGTVAWNTNESTSGIVYVGTSSPLTLGNSTKNTASATGTAHSVSFTGLAENTTYRFFIVARDAFGNYATSTTMNFTTGVAADTQAPTISSLAHSDIATTTAKITFTTNENATSKLWFATTTPVSTSGTANQNIATFITGHTYNLSGLSASTTYRYIVTATDNSGNTSTSTEHSFTTTD